jgi:NAD(P)-dependent dehydrogenase (short-subunit alcohol dehydrogenase family)
LSDAAERFNLDGKLAIVTGASRGLGRAIALGLAEHGARLALVSRGEERLREVAAEASAPAEVFAADLAETSSLPGVFEKIKARCGVPEVLVNCAGTTYRGAAIEQPLEEWRRVLAVNLDAPLILSQCFARELLGAKRGGKILNICSLLSGRSRPTVPAYTASKTALAGLTRALAVEWMQHGINVNAIGPGYFETELTAPLKDQPEFDAWVTERAPVGRWGQPQDIVGTAVYLCSPASDFVTGQLLYVDGGWMAAL